ncbi:hypothetical protein LLG46_13200 [bacterium]|nr:hypothetical protein [bacterium]
MIKHDKSSFLIAGPLHLQSLDIPEPEPEMEEEIDPVAEAVKQADAIVCRAKAESDSISQEARLQGYNTGLQEGNEQFQNLIERLEVDIQLLTEDRQAVLDTIEPEMLKLCTEAVEKIIRHEVKTDPKVVHRVIKSCLRKIRDTSDVRMRVNPSELDNVKAMRDELMSMADGMSSISIVDDRRISPGGCVIETPSGDFDATIENQMNRIKKKLGDTYENDRGECPGPK